MNLEKAVNHSGYGEVGANCVRPMGKYYNRLKALDSRRVRRVAMVELRFLR
jgi:hypothetical protein